MAALLYGGAASIASQPAADMQPPVRASEAQQEHPHIALLLPVSSAAFARSSEAVKNGFVAAAAHGKAGLPIRLYPVSDDAQSAVLAYREALGAGARVAVGPLTRNGVTAVAASNAVRIPTVALNVPEGTAALPLNLYVLSLNVESEARQVARLAAREGRAYAVTVFSDTPLSRRIQQAFVDEFARSGGRHVAAHGYTSDAAQLARISQAVGRSGADMAFLALDFQRGRVLRSYLDALPVYATSHIHPGNLGLLAGFDLEQVRFMDMPWILQPDHPAVMIYQQRELQADLDLERLYALGIDAFRVARGLLDGSPVPLDGVTGRLTVSSDRYYVRELTRAQFIDGKLVVHADSP